MTLAITGIRGGRNSTESRNAAKRSWAGRMCREWKAPLVASGTQRAPGAARTAARSALTLSAGPDTTTWVAVLRLARSTSVAPLRSSRARTASGDRPTTASMAPPSASPISSPRRHTIRRPVSKSKQPAASSALYSPRLCPARTSGAGPSASACAQASALTTYSAGWVHRVRFSRPSGSSRHRSRTDSPRTRSAAATYSGKRSKRPCPIPTRCAPWPAKSQALTRPGGAGTAAARCPRWCRTRRNGPRCRRPCVRRRTAARPAPGSRRPCARVRAVPGRRRSP